MSIGKNAFWLAGILLFGTFCAFTAMAEVRHSEAYENLTAVELAPGEAPRLINGVSELSGSERQHREHLPVQLASAIKRVQRGRYHPEQRRLRDFRKL